MNFYDEINELLYSDDNIQVFQNNNNKENIMSDTSDKIKPEVLDLFNNDFGYLSNYSELSPDPVDIDATDRFQYSGYKSDKIEDIIEPHSSNCNISFTSDFSNENKGSNFNSPSSVYSSQNSLKNGKTEDIFVLNSQNSTKSSIPISSAIHHMSLLTNLVKENSRKQETVTKLPALSPGLSHDNKKNVLDTIVDINMINEFPELELFQMDSYKKIFAEKSKFEQIPKVAKPLVGKTQKKKANRNFNEKSKYDKDLTKMVKKNRLCQSRGGRLMTPVSPISSNMLTDFDSSLVEKIKNDNYLSAVASKKQKRGSYRCNHCPEMFSTILEYAEHLDKYRIRRKYNCPISNCPWKILGLPGRSDLRRHCAIQHKDELDDQLRASLNLKESVYVTTACPNKYCHKTFRRKDAYNRHVSIVHNMPGSRFNKRLAAILKRCPSNLITEEERTNHIIQAMNSGAK
ncbi:similar to Saccharomyces cerevisiae YGR044C RME1 Zinc finger protein involved in control of meiosis [Maudiozyma saulgeensis]|uniref:Similar to Saccharomyces cerevisiae YGR044C RME1 Zinc finger protein involved in control of meiosis n=1 Tax=Maudiozyma saulgeensis TaxID=1789683 RepID=A0A1X7QZJ9_9SACH|nr:similar to Saccharomyces cerevisiae YGR044C RME1 Zinc finger protein involved in control of meiosis [Kazachstania saulgeensis]